MEEINKIKEGILYLLQFDEGFTLIEIKDYLSLNSIDTPVRLLHRILEELEDSGYLKERHFGNVRDGRVDYAMERMGDNFLDKIKKEKEMHKLWKLPDFKD
jgi:DNA-binding transcriptional MerR regulator